ncbi:MAG: mechanosensitive ion channel family protein, partial [Candidatus Aenigmatarchaeota archaeon]
MEGTLGDTATVLENLWQSFAGNIGNFIGFLVILIVGWIIGRIVGKVIREILIRGKVDEYVKKEGHLNFEASSLFDTIARWIIYIVFISEAVAFLEIGMISNFLFNYVLPGVGGIIGAGIVLLVAYMVGIYFKEGLLQHEENEETPYADLSGKIVFYLSMFFGTALALDIFFRLALNQPAMLLQGLILILAASLGIGAAISLGLGLKDVVNDMAEDYAE